MVKLGTEHLVVTKKYLRDENTRPWAVDFLIKLADQVSASTAHSQAEKNSLVGPIEEKFKTLARRPAEEYSLEAKTRAVDYLDKKGIDYKVKSRAKRR